ncbi:MAG TPA: anti-sigma factor [Gemmatimonadaceae bacterium]|nr:anti-sigma factor [Gemmatimonadaceae bacterium]
MTEPFEHPPESVLAAYLDRELGNDERTQVEAHLDQCAECRRGLAETVDVLALSEEAGLPAKERASVVGRSRRLAWLGTGMALAASIAAMVVLRRPAVPDGDIDARTRDAAATTIDGRMPRLAVVEPVAGSAGVAEQPTFTWHQADADRYSFRLLAEDGVPVWSRETPDTTVTLPSDVRLDRGRTYFWRVDALATGIVASTRAQRFTVSP